MTYSWSHSLLDSWDLAPGEAISQSPSIRAAQGERTLLCPAPTLDTEEFLAQNACSEDCSSVDSLAAFGLASGEIRSPSPLGTFHGSQLPQCPPPTLDTQEFENTIGSKDVWIVEDSLACSDLALGEHRSPGPVLDMSGAPGQFYTPTLESQDFGKSRVMSDDVWLVEDSLACWDNNPGEARLDGTLNQFDYFKSLGFPSSIDVKGFETDEREQQAAPLSSSTLVNCSLEPGNSGEFASTLLVPLSTSAAKRSLSPTSLYGGSAKCHKRVKLDRGSNFSNDRILLVPSAARSICGASIRKVSTFKDTENLMKQNLEVAKLEKHTLPETVPPIISDGNPAATNFEDVPFNTTSVTRFAPMDVTNSRVFPARSPTKSNSDILSCLTESHEVILVNKVEHLTNTAGFPSKNVAVSENHQLGLRPDVDAKSLSQKTGSGGQSIAKVKTSLDFEPFLISVGFESSKSRKLGEPNSEGWFCPEDGKKFRPTSKQLSLDRWISLV